MNTKTGAAALLGALVLSMTGLSFAQQLGPRGPWQDPSQAIRVSVAPSVPLSIIEKDTSATRVRVQGSLMIIELRCDLTVRNESSQYLRGVTFAIQTDRLAAGGRATVALPSLNVEPDATFSADLNLRLLRPLPAAPDDVIQVDVDGVLLADLSFHGPNRFHSRRRMIVWELEANRDRQHFRSLLALGGPQQLRSAIVASLERQSRRSKLEARFADENRGPGSRKPETEAPRRLELASVNLSEAPLEVVSGISTVAGETARSPRITVKNRSPKPIRYFEIGWLVSDPQGNRYTAGWVPSTGRELPPGGLASTTQEREFVLRPKSAVSRFAISAMSGYVSQVEFEDGSFWVPTRKGLEKSDLINAAPVSAEEQRLTGLYASQGLDGVIRELSKF